MSGTTERTILFITGNQGKLSEVQAYLDGIPHVHLKALSIDLPELQAATSAEISRLKAVEAFRVVNKLTPHDPLPPDGTPVLVDDTSLGFRALNNLPGAYIKWFLKSIGSEGLVKLTEGFRVPGDADNTHRLAVASCVFSYCTGSDTNGKPHVVQFVGECPGRIVDTPRGAKGFGWDPIFAPEVNTSGTPYSHTFAEMEVAEKNVISHRARALEKLHAYLSAAPQSGGAHLLHTPVAA